MHNNLSIIGLGKVYVIILKTITHHPPVSTPNLKLFSQMPKIVQRRKHFCLHGLFTTTLLNFLFSDQLNITFSKTTAFSCIMYNASFSECEVAINSLNGRWFGGKTISAALYDEQRFLREDLSG